MPLDVLRQGTLKTKETSTNYEISCVLLLNLGKFMLPHLVFNFWFIYF